MCDEKCASVEDKLNRVLVPASGDNSDIRKAAINEGVMIF